MTMPTFSQRHGYTKLEKAMIRECMPITIINSLCSAFDYLRQGLQGTFVGDKNKYVDLEEFLWLQFLNKRLGDFRKYNKTEIVATTVIKDISTPWYRKLDMVEMAIEYLAIKSKKDSHTAGILKSICEYINHEFERHGYAYRVIDKRIVEITSKEEKASIEEALSKSKDNIKMHLTNALEAYAKKPEGDYTNSIKESISAVEAICREKTGEETLGKAIKSFEKNGLNIPSVMKDALVKLYTYTNQPTTGIRHSLMDADSGYIPGNEEARYMLIVCSAFINYIRTKCK